MPPVSKTVSPLRYSLPVRIALSLPLAASLAAWASPAEARPRHPVIVQVTELTSGTIEEVHLRRQKGASITFVSDGDVTGTAPGNREVYHFDTESRVLTKVTDTPGGESYDVSQEIDDIGRGDRPAFLSFVSTGDFDPDVDNSDGNPEVFLWEIETGRFRQITDTAPPVVNAHPFPSDSGACIVFSSNGDLSNNNGGEPNDPGTGFTNPDGSMEVFQYVISKDGMYPYAGIMTQISDGPAGTVSDRPVVGGYWYPRQCQSTAYISDHDQTGEGLSGENMYVFSRWNGRVERMDVRDRFLPEGVPDGIYRRPHISGASNFARGPFIVFTSEADIWNNNSTGLNLFRYRVFHPKLEQFTDLDSGNVRHPQVSDGGGKIMYQSNGDHIFQVRRPKGVDTALNADGNNEIFYQNGRRKMQQITNTVDCENELPSMQDDATAVAFRSTCDLVPGNNPDGQQQVFLFFNVKRDDPILSPEVCRVEDGCCNEANGCYTPYLGKALRVSRKNCATRSPERCDDRRRGPE